MTRKPLYILGTCLLMSASCTNLDPDIYSDMTIDKIMADSEESSAYLLTPIYGQMRWFNEDRSIWDLTELGTDAWIIPTNTDGGWYDGGIWQRINNHEWKSTDPHFINCWNHLWYGITTCCNRALYQFEQAGLELDAQTHAEVRSVRAFYYYYLLSLFGNVPIMDTYDVPKDFMPATKSRKEVYDFVVSELRQSIEDLPEERRYSRFNKWAAKHLLAKVYLNAEAWLGSEYASKRDSTLILCNEIIGSGQYELDSDFSNIFSLKSETSPEIIFAVPYDETTGTPIFHCIYAKTQHWACKPIYNAGSGGYNGLRAVPSYVNETFDAKSPDEYNDKRYRQSYCMGQQYDYVSGEPLYFTDGVTPFNYINEIASAEAAREFDGYRFGKYEIKVGQKWETDQDWVVFRLGETLMMKAECLLRKGDSQGAADIVNQVRARSFDASLPEAVRKLTAGQLAASTVVDGVSVPYGEFLKELGREFTGEGLRREQLIRWDLYVKGSWSFHKPNNKKYQELFPIPSSELLSNINLLQNDGYSY